MSHDLEFQYGTASMVFVGKDYKVVQNRDAFGILEPLIDERLAD